MFKKEFDDITRENLIPLNTCTNSEKQSQDMITVIKTYIKLQDLLQNDYIQRLYVVEGADQKSELNQILDKMTDDINKCFKENFSKIEAIL